MNKKFLIITGIIIFLFLGANHWMSNEVNKPVAVQPVVKTIAEDINNSVGAVAVDSMPLEKLKSIEPETVQETAVKAATVAEKTNSQKVEPVYDVPSQDVIMVN